MKKFAIALVVLVSCLIAVAQNQPSSMVSAKIPFSFYVNNVQYPAGEYLFKSTDIAGNFVAISGSATRYHMTADQKTSERVKESKLVFVYERGKMYLHQVWVQGDDHVHDINHKAGLKELAVK